MESEELCFENDYTLTPETAERLQIFSEDQTLSNSSISIHKPEGYVLFNPDACRIVRIPATEQLFSPLKIIDRKKWDLHLIYIPFSLEKAQGHRAYQEMKFRVTLANYQTIAFELLPTNVKKVVDAQKTYSISPRLNLTFYDLQPEIRALGEGLHDFYWLYEKAAGEKALYSGGRYVVLLLQVPCGTLFVGGAIAYELVMAKRFGRKEVLDKARTIPWRILWNLRDAPLLGTADIASKRTAIIMTTNDQQYLAVRAYLNDLQEIEHQRGTVYERGKFLAYGQCWEVALVQASGEMAHIASEAERAIQQFQPAVVLFIGAASGLKDVQPGDVVIANKVYNYESGRAEGTFKTRPGLYHSTYRMENRAQAERRKTDWLRHLEHDATAGTAKIHIGPLATGEKEIVSPSSSSFKLLNSHYNDALAVQVGSYSLLHAVHINRGIESLVICGISNMVGEEPTEQSCYLAAQRASAFLFEVLAKLGNPAGREV